MGTQAFHCYSALLGAFTEAALARTNELDIAQDRTLAVAVAVEETADPSLGEALARAEKFLPIPDLEPAQPTTSWQAKDRAIRVDVLTPMKGKQSEGAVRLSTLGVFARPIPFLDYLLADTTPAAIPTGSGVLARVPTPARYAIHKLIVSQNRDTAFRDKSNKDLAQAAPLLEVLLADQPDEIADAWHDMTLRGRKWTAPARTALDRLPESISVRLAGVCG